MPLARLRDAELPQQLGEALAILGEVDRIRRGAENPDARLLQRQRQLQRRLPAVLHDDRDVAAALPLARDDREHVLEGQRLEIQAIDGVVVGGNGLRVAVDHHRLEALLAEREGGVAAAVVELDPLPDAVRAAAEDDHLGARRGIGLALALVGAVEIGRERLEFRGAGVDALVGGLEARVGAARAHRVLVGAENRAELAIADAGALERAQHLGRHPAQAAEAGRARQLDELRELRQEPGIDLRQLVQFLDRPAAVERAEDRPHAPIGGHAQLALQRAFLFFLGQAGARPCAPG